MDFDELITAWYPQAVSLFEQTQAASLANLVQVIHGRQQRS